MRLAISARGIGKRFALGERQSYFTAREAVQKWLDWRGWRGGQPETARDEIWALRNVAFQVEPGEVVGIIGHNGAGKSTLLKILSRITEPTEGEIELFGRVSSLLEVGTGFHPELTGRENVYLNGSILGMKKKEIDARFDEIVAFSGVERFIDTPVKRYSSGLSVRLAFAVAAHLEPEILLIDEVLAVGDAEFQRKCLGKIGDVARGGRTVLFVSHNLAAVENLCDRALLLDHGTIAFAGAAGDAVQAYGARLGARQPKDCRPGEYVTRVEMHDGRKPVTSIRMGDGVRIRVAFSTPRPTQAPRVGLVIRRRASGEAVFAVNSDLVGFELPSRPGREFEANFDFDRLNLVQGNYTIDVYAGADGRNHEIIEASAELVVAESDVFGTGRRPLTKFGPVYMPARLSLTCQDTGEVAAA